MCVLITKAAIRRATIACFVLAGFLPCVAVSAGLQTGIWHGTYTVSQLRAQYDVSSVTEGALSRHEIIMVLPELEPRFAFTYELEDVRLQGKSLSFTIRKAAETQQCVLERQPTNQYRGFCRSDADHQGVLAVEISMSPPEGDAEESAVQEVDRAPGKPSTDEALPGK